VICALSLDRSAIPRSDPEPRPWQDLAPLARIRASGCRTTQLVLRFSTWKKRSSGSTLSIPTSVALRASAMRDSAYGLVLPVDILMNTPVKSFQSDYTAPHSLSIFCSLYPIHKLLLLKVCIRIKCARIRPTCEDVQMFNRTRHRTTSTTSRKRNGGRMHEATVFTVSACEEQR
jgi:hypothetical protein